MRRTPNALLVLAVLLLAVACGGPGADESLGSQTSDLTVATGVDFSWARPSPAGLKAEGYTFAARYLSHDTTGKTLSKAEAAVLWAAGVDVVVGWEDSGTAALGGFAQGVADATAANAQSVAFGAPPDRPIYFAVDFDASAAQQGTLNAYFDGVASVIGVARTGAYAGYYVIQRLFDAKKIAFGWQTYAWSYGNWDARAQLRQVQNGVTAAGDGSCCDKDQAVAPDFGQWHANQAPRGYLDVAACTGIGGWAQDLDAPGTSIAVHVYIDGPAGAAGAIGIPLVAGDNRADLCTAIGSCNHGYTLDVPRHLLDGKAHPVYAYGIDTAGGANTLLSGSPRSFTCADATPPLDVHKGVKRHVKDPASMTAWAFSSLYDLAPESDAVVNAYPTSDDWEAKPALVKADDNTPEVWLIDGTTRRHVTSAASLAAWHRTAAEVVKTPAAKVYAYTKGPDLPAEPFLVQGSAPAVWVIDVAPPPPPSTGADGGNGGTSEDGGAPGVGPPGNGVNGTGPSDAPVTGDTNGEPAGGQAGGCSMHTSASTSGSPWLALLCLSAVVALRRRRSQR